MATHKAATTEEIVLIVVSTLFLLALAPFTYYLLPTKLSSKIVNNKIEGMRGYSSEERRSFEAQVAPLRPWPFNVSVEVK